MLCIFSAVKFSKVPCCSVMCSLLKQNAVKCSEELFIAVLYSAVQCSVVDLSAMQCFLSGLGVRVSE